MFTTYRRKVLPLFSGQKMKMKAVKVSETSQNTTFFVAMLFPLITKNHHLLVWYNVYFLQRHSFYLFHLCGLITYLLSFCFVFSFCQIIRWRVVCSGLQRHSVRWKSKDVWEYISRFVSVFYNLWSCSINRHIRRNIRRRLLPATNEHSYTGPILPCEAVNRSFQLRCSPLKLKLQSIYLRRAKPLQRKS
jgi:hypothetical protein